MNKNESHANIKPKYWLIILFLLSVVTAFILMYNYFRPNPNMVMLKIGYSPYSVNVPLFLAVDEGLFAQEGIHVDLIPFQSTDQMMEALKAGQVDVASALTAESVYVSNQKVPGMIEPFFFNTFVSDSSVDAIVASSGSLIRAPMDLAGKKIGVLPADMMRIALMAYLEKQAIDSNSVTIIILPPTSILAAMSSKSVDACYLLEPLVSVSAEKMKARIVQSGVGARGITDPLPAGFHSVRAIFAEQNPALIQKLIKVYIMGANTTSNRSAVAKVLEAYCGLKPPISQSVALPQWSAWTPNLQVNLEVQFYAMKRVLNWDVAAFTNTHCLQPK